MCSLASATAVELLVALLNHPLQRAAIASDDLFKCDRSALGPIPHQIRGDLSEYKTLPLLGEAFDMCIACSQSIIDQFKQPNEEAFNFLLQACNVPGFLEEQSGLASKLRDMKLGEIEDFDDFAMDDEDEAFDDAEFPKEEEDKGNDE